jgi:hypothetical protein
MGSFMYPRCDLLPLSPATHIYGRPQVQGPAGGLPRQEGAKTSTPEEAVRDEAPEEGIPNCCPGWPVLGVVIERCPAWGDSILDH